MHQVRRPEIDPETTSRHGEGPEDTVDYDPRAVFSIETRKFRVEGLARLQIVLVVGAFLLFFSWPVLWFVSEAFFVNSILLEVYHIVFSSFTGVLAAIVAFYFATEGKFEFQLPSIFGKDSVLVTVRSKLAPWMMLFIVTFADIGVSAAMGKPPTFTPIAWVCYVTYVGARRVREIGERRRERAKAEPDPELVGFLDKARRQAASVFAEEV